MKNRWWVILLGLLVIAVGVTSYYAWRILKVNDQIKRLVVREMGPFLGEGFSLDKVKVGLGSIKLENVLISSKESPFTFRIGEMKVGYSLVHLVLSGLNPKEGTHQIFLDSPEVELHLSDDGGFIQYPRGETAQFSLLLDAMPKTSLIIRNGRILIRRRDDILRFAYDIQGSVDLRNASLIPVILKGRVLSGKTNLDLRGSLDTGAQKGRFTIDVTDINFGFPGMDIFSNNIIPLEGSMDLHLTIETGDSLGLSGTFLMKDMTLDIQDLGVRIDHLTIPGRINERTVTFEGAGLNIWNTTPSLSGWIRMQPQPNLHVTAEFDDLNLKTFFDELIPSRKGMVVGRGRLRLQARGTPPTVKIDGFLFSDSLVVGGITLSGFQLNLSKDPDSLHVSLIQAKYGNSLLRFEGLLRGTREHALVTGQFGVAFPEKPAAEMSYEISGDINLKEGQAEILLGGSPFSWGDFTIPEHDITLTVFPDSSSFLVDLGDLDINGSLMRGSEGISYNAKVTAEDFYPSVIMDVTPRNLRVRGSYILSGDTEHLLSEYALELFLGKQFQAVLRGKGRITDPFLDRRKGTMAVELEDLRVGHERFSLTGLADINSDKIGITLSEKEGHADMEITMKAGNDSLYGIVELHGFPLERIIGMAKRMKGPMYGPVSGVIRMGGTLRHPVIFSDGDLQYTNGRLGLLDSLSGTVVLRVTSDRILFDPVRVYRNGYLLASGVAHRLKGEDLHIEVRGEDVDFSQLSPLFQLDREISGKADYLFTMAANRDSAVIGEESFGRIQNGRFYDIPFDRIFADLRGGSHGFFVENFTIEKSDLYEVHGSARSSFFYKDKGDVPSLEIDLGFSGDILGVTTDLFPVLGHGNGRGSFQMKFGGTWASIVPIRGEITVGGGVFNPRFLLHELTDVNGLLRFNTLDESGNPVGDSLTVFIVGLNGRTENSRIKVRNLWPDRESLWPDTTLVSAGIKPIRKKSLNLNLGVITIDVDMLGRGGKKGYASLSIPGFMRRGDTGQFNLKGKNPFKRFFIGTLGDGEMVPVISGHIEVTRAEITYPLLKTESKAKSGFLRNVLWDLRITTGPDVHYFLEQGRSLMRNVVGTTLIDTRLNVEEGSWVEVTGRIEDGTFAVNGNLASYRGTIATYGKDFEVEEIHLSLNTAVENGSTIMGRAVYENFIDDLGVQRQIYLDVIPIPEEDTDFQEIRKGTRIFNSYLALTSDDPYLQKDAIYRQMGISPGTINETAMRALTSGLDSYYFRPYLKPLERKLERWTTFDMIRFRTTFVGNITDWRIKNYLDRRNGGRNLDLFGGSQITIGESLSDDLFLTYTGRVRSGPDEYQRYVMGLQHEFGLEYLVQSGTKIEFKYDYDPLLRKEDRRIQLRHHFLF